MKAKSKKRELIAPRGDKRYIRRDAKGRIKESDDRPLTLPGHTPQGQDGPNPVRVIVATAR
jgi:hypothetical protein